MSSLDASVTDDRCSFELPNDDSSESLEQIAYLCNELENGVKMTRRRKYYVVGSKGEPVFSGSDAISFLVDNGYAKSRGKALVMGRRMAYDCSLFHHESNDFDLEDDKNLFYRFTTPDQRIVKTPEYDDFATLRAVADAFEEGVIVGPNMQFVGKDAVTFLVDSSLAKSRQDAVRIGQLIMEKHAVFRPIARKDATFKDKHLLYEFVPKNQRADLIKTKTSLSIPIEDTAQYFVDIVEPGNNFSGSEAVDAIVDRGLAATRSEAVLLGEKMTSDLQLFHCVQDRQRAFLDRQDVYYEYCKKHEMSLSLSLHSMEINDIEEESASGDDSECLTEEETEADIQVNGSNEEPSMIPSTITQQAYMKKGSIGSKEDIHIGDLEYPISVEGKSEGGSSTGSGRDLMKESPVSVDKFGFIIENDEDRCDLSEVSDSFNDNAAKTIQKEWTEDEWRLFLDECTASGSARLSSATRDTFKRMIRIGLPDSLRRQAWTTLTGVGAIVREREGDYQALADTGTLFMEDESNSALQGGQSLKGLIERDLHRTFPQHCLFYDRNVDGGKIISQVLDPADDDTTDVESAEKLVPDGLASLRRVLYAYAIYDNEVGYCQGMNFIAAMFLTFLSEEESFWLLVAVMNDEPYSMRNLFAEDMAGVKETLFVADKILQKFLPKLHKHMVQEDVDLSMFATRWFMTIFTSVFPFSLVSRVWDVYLVEGWKVVYRVMVCLLGHAQLDLMDLDMEDILTYLRDEFPSKIKGPSILRESLKVPLRHRHIRKYTNEWRVGRTGNVRNYYYRKRSSICSESGESIDSNSMGIPKKNLLKSVSGSGRHITKKLFPGPMHRSSTA